MADARGPKRLKKENQKNYQTNYPHIAPEIVEGQAGQSIQSDIYSLGKLVETIYIKGKLGEIPEVIVKAISPAFLESPQCRQIV